MGLYFYRARWYEAENGKILSKDPLLDPRGNGLYSYVSENPQRFIDPSGMVFIESFLYCKFHCYCCPQGDPFSCTIGGKGTWCGQSDTPCNCATNTNMFRCKNLLGTPQCAYCLTIYLCIGGGGGVPCKGGTFPCPLSIQYANLGRPGRTTLQSMAPSDKSSFLTDFSARTFGAFQSVRRWN